MINLIICTIHFLQFSSFTGKRYVMRRVWLPAPLPHQPSTLSMRVSCVQPLAAYRFIRKVACISNITQLPRAQPGMGISCAPTLSSRHHLWPIGRALTAGSPSTGLGWQTRCWHDSTQFAKPNQATASFVRVSLPAGEAGFAKKGVRCEPTCSTMWAVDLSLIMQQHFLCQSACLQGRRALQKNAPAANQPARQCGQWTGWRASPCGP
jgi:hypothetical protein